MARLRLLRAVLLSGLTLVLCMIVRPAFASEAPFCDDRGASAIALPPALDASDQAVARALACSQGGDFSAYLATFTRARCHAELSLQGVDAAASAEALEVGGSSQRGLSDLGSASAPPTVVRSRIDRPPRS